MRGDTMLNKNDMSMLLAEAANRLKSIYGSHLMGVILFGSYARGDFDKDSDIDIAVILDLERGQESTYRAELIEFSTELDMKYDTLTSFRCIPHSEFEKWKNTLPFYLNIQKEGIQIA